MYEDCVIYQMPNKGPEHIDILTLPFLLDIEAKDLRNAVSDVPGKFLRDCSFKHWRDHASTLQYKIIFA